MSYQSDIIKAAKQNGFQLDPKAAATLNAYLGKQITPLDMGADMDERAAWSATLRSTILAVLNKVKEAPLQSSKLNAAQIEAALAALHVVNPGEVPAKMRVIDVIGAFEQPRFHYDTVRRIFFEVQSERTKFGVAEERAEMLRSRYTMLFQRVQRNPLLQQNKMGGGDDMDDDNAEPPLCTIESLLGQTGKKCIFGQLCQLTDGTYSLEDIHSHVTLDLRSPSLEVSIGFFTEGCFVLCEGETRESDGVFQVAALIMPPAERKKETIRIHPALDWLGSDLTAALGSSASSAAAAGFKSGTADARLKQQLLTSPLHQDDMIVIFSDVYLDQPRTLTRLATVFEGLRGRPIQAVVFMGNFTSAPVANQPGEMARLKSYFDALCDTLLKFPQLCRDTHFVLIPGPRDLPASLGSVLPCPSLPGILTARLRERLSQVTCGTNPCRLSWVNKELLLFREDLLHKMQRAAIRPPDQEASADNSQHLIRTLIDQSHLCPLPQDRRPTYWNFDHALRMYPLPDELVLADCVDPYEHQYAGVHVANPGSFVDGAFMLYYPARKIKERESDPDGLPVVEFSRTTDVHTA